jgi:hypothetical protein
MTCQRSAGALAAIWSIRICDPVARRAAAGAQSHKRDIPAATACHVDRGLRYDSGFASRTTTLTARRTESVPPNRSRVARRRSSSLRDNGHGPAEQHAQEAIFVRGVMFATTSIGIALDA